MAIPILLQRIQERVDVFSLSGIPSFKEKIPQKRCRYSAGIEQVWRMLESIHKAMLISGQWQGETDGLLKYQVLQ